jgi:hypothetical protein
LRRAAGIAKRPHRTRMPLAPARRTYRG